MEKTLGLLIMIGLGLVLQRQIKQPDQLTGIKTIILSLALPATIFIALLRVDLQPGLLYLPLLGIGINLFLILAFSVISPLFKSINDRKKRTLLLLLPSLAPGLSCFPFIVEYLGADQLAFAALMDVGNKFFVLIFLYLLAMHWYFLYNRIHKGSRNEDLRKMLKKMFTEPINLIMIVALVLLGFGLNVEALPSLVSSTFLKLSSIMSPLILLFIGLAVKLKGNQIKMIFQLLICKSGLLLLGSALFIYLSPELSPLMILLAIVFPQSSCSFWPFAHINLINNQETEGAKTFDLDFGLAIVACSLPFSSILIIGVLSFPAQSANPTIIGLLGLTLLALSLLPPLISLIKKTISRPQGRLTEAEGLPSIN